MVLRLALDVNVWVNHCLSLSRGRDGSVAQRLVRSSFDGHCRLGPIQPIVSHAMLDTLQEVLARIGFPEAIAEAARNAIESSATEGAVRQPPHLVFAGGLQPVKDAEDRAVLETAIAGGADLLVTSNMQDFTPGPRAGIDAEVVRASAKGQADVLLLKHARLPHGLVIASAPVAHSWLLDGNRPPDGILERFLPQ